MVSTRFLLVRLVWGLVTLWVLVTLTFAALRVVPGGPFDREKKLPERIKANVEAKYHLDKPLPAQYGLFLVSLCRGDLGPSYKYLGRSVNDILRETFPISLQLGLLAVTGAVLAGIGLGTAAAVRVNTAWDRGTLFLTSLGISVPGFALAAGLILVFADRLLIFPPALWEGWRYMVLPAVALGTAPAAYLANLTRSAVLEVIRTDYIRTARAKGLPERTVILRHAVRNAVFPVVTMAGPLTAALITGSFVVEFIFSIPGMGGHFVTAVTNRDYPLVMGVTIVYAVLVILANLAVDVLYHVLDPRLRKGN
jgi:oligopeptide transport system permease protein